MKNTRKTFGNICLIGALVCFALAMICIVCDFENLFFPFAMLYAFGLILGIILRIGDFFKWRGRMLMQGMQEANLPSAPVYFPSQQAFPVTQPEITHQPEKNPPSIKFCRHCGKVIVKDFAFCPACGEKI